MALLKGQICDIFTHNIYRYTCFSWLLWFPLYIATYLTFFVEKGSFHFWLYTGQPIARAFQRLEAMMNNLWKHTAYGPNVVLPQYWELL